MSDLLTAVGRAVASSGLDLIAATNIDAYDAVVPPTWRLGPRVPHMRSLVVLGHGGGIFWRRFAAARRRHPWLRAEADPLDAFTRHVVADAVATVTISRAMPIRVVHPFDAGPLVVSFQHLAEVAGLGRRSLLGVLLHPEYGPWMAFRAALLVPVAVRAPRPADGFDPCPTCVLRPCVSACPAAAVSAAGWDARRCSEARRPDDEPCGLGCHARMACVIGPEHRYSPDAMAHHQAAARAHMRRT